MLKEFDALKAITIPNMNGGKGTIFAKMLIGSEDLVLFTVVVE